MHCRGARGGVGVRRRDLGQVRLQEAAGDRAGSGPPAPPRLAAARPSLETARGPGALPPLPFALAAAAAPSLLSPSRSLTPPPPPRPPHARQHVVQERFLGFTLDTGSIYNGIDFTSPKLAALLSQLGPTVLRIGGTAADYTW